MEIEIPIIPNITSTKNENPNSKIFDVIESICECGECFDCLVKEQHRKTDEEYRKEWAKERKNKIMAMFDENSLLNPRLKEATFEAYKPTNSDLEKAKSIIKRYADNFSLDNPISLLLIGGYGTGKSHLGVAVTKELMQKDYSCIFISTPKLMTKIRSTYSRDSRYTEDQIISQLSNVDCLVLDDIGAEATKQGESNQHTWATSKVFEIIDNRVGKHTIFTSNYDLNELQQRLGGRNFSRMMEAAHVIEMHGDDYRLKNYK